MPMDQATIARLEKGKRRVTIDEAFTFAYALDVAPAYLFLPVDDDVDSQSETQVSVTPNRAVAGGIAREWLRGNAPLPDQDSRKYWTQRPDQEWKALQEGGWVIPPGRRGDPDDGAR